MKYAQIIHDYGEKLGVENAILNKYKILTEAASTGEWPRLIKLLYDLKDEVTEELYRADMKDEAVMALVSGWLEGLYIVAKSLENLVPVPEKVNSILGNRDFIRYLRDNLSDIKESYKIKRELKETLALLPEIDKIINKSREYIFTNDDVKQIIRIYEPWREMVIMD